MNTTHEPQTDIFVDEYYTYRVTIGDLTDITCEQSEGRIRVQVPYNGRLLQRIQSDAPALHLGRIRLANPQPSIDQPTLMIDLPMVAVDERVKRCEQHVWQARYALPPPRDTLIAIDAEVFDGADIDVTNKPDHIAAALFGQADVFANDLRLRVSLWSPDLAAHGAASEASHMLRAALLEQESDTQIMLLTPAHLDLVAQSMAALANTSGGRILFGVQPNGNVEGFKPEIVEAIERYVLQAALRCTPPVALSAPRVDTYKPDMTGPGAAKQVASVSIEHRPGHVHVVDGQFYRRRNGATTIEPAPRLPSPPYERHPISIRDALSQGNSRDVVIIDATNHAPSQIDLAPYLCGLLNANLSVGFILIRHLTTTRGFFRQQRGVVQQLNERLRSEIQRLTPALSGVQIDWANVDNERIAVIAVPGNLAPVALCDRRGYVWDFGVLREISIHDVFQRYLQRLGTAAVASSRTAEMRMEYGEMQWPVQPPTDMKAVAAIDQNQHNPGTYDAQRRAIVWRNRRFDECRGTNGLQCQLTTRLRQAFTNVQHDHDHAGKSNGVVLSSMPLSGRIQLCFDHVLASNTTVQCEPADTDIARNLLGQAPIHQRTHITVHLKLHTDELFEQRRRTILLHTRAPDVTFSNERNERVADLQQALADNGFWVDTPSAIDGANGSTIVLFNGIRSTDFHDIHLLAGVRSESNSLTRELRYEQRMDSKTVDTGALEIRLMLWGSGDKVAQKLVNLQLDLSQLIQDRLHFLRST